MPKSSIERSNVEEQIGVLRDMYARTGVLHEAQALQLRMWPLAVFKQAKSSEAHLDHPKKEIDFYLKMDGKPKKDEAFELACEQLDDSVKWLLGEDWLVRIRVLDKVVYRGMRRTKVKEESNDDGNAEASAFGPTTNPRPNV